MKKKILKIKIRCLILWSKVLQLNKDVNNYLQNMTFYIIVMLKDIFCVKVKGHIIIGVGF